MGNMLRKNPDEEIIQRKYVPVRKDGKPYAKAPRAHTLVLMVREFGGWEPEDRCATEEDLRAFGFVRVAEDATGGGVR